MSPLDPTLDGVFTVGELTRDIQGVLRTTFEGIQVRGEISQPRTPRSGHIYLTLKDADAVLPCVIWRSAVARLPVDVEEGVEVIAFGSLDVYPPHGKYQFIIRRLLPVGAGALQAAFERMRARLDKEGLFDPEHKQPLPAWPRRIVLITSKTSAAVRDMVHVIRRRMPSAVILLLSVRVQGEGAAEEVAQALRLADQHARADAIIVGRGGGSLEDLWAFNEEVVARAIHECRTPVVSAVGHETDTTIADLVADVRAATPSQAGELVVPDAQEFRARLARDARELKRLLRTRLDQAWQRLEAVAERRVLRDPLTRARAARERLRHLQQRLDALSPRSALTRRRARLAELRARLAPPLQRTLVRHQARMAEAGRRLPLAMAQVLSKRDRRLDAARLQLRALSPLSVLERGYSLTQLLSGPRAGRAIRREEDVSVGDMLRTRLSDGAEVDSLVERVRGARDEGPGDSA